MTEWTAGLVTIDHEFAAMAEWRPSERWNGWLCPWFDAGTAVEVLEHLNELNAGEYEMAYDWDDDVLVITELDYVTEEGYEPDRYVPRDGLYQLGGHAWTWSEWRSDDEESK